MKIRILPKTFQFLEGSGRKARSVLHFCLQRYKLQTAVTLSLRKQKVFLKFGKKKLKNQERFKQEVIKNYNPLHQFIQVHIIKSCFT